MELYLKLIDVIFPVFALVGVGYYLGKKNPKYDTTFITNFAAKFGSPALAFYAITSTGVTFYQFIDYFFYTILAVIGFSIIGVIFLLARNIPKVKCEIIITAEIAEAIPIPNLP